MSAPLADVTQTQTRLPPGQMGPPAMPPPPPREAIIESIAAAKMRRPIAEPVSDGYGSRFAPWTTQSPAVGGGGQPEPPVFVVPVDEPKLESLRAALAAGHVVNLLGALDENDPTFGSARLRRTASSALTFGQRARRATAKSHEAVAYVLRLPAADTSRDLELRISLKHLPAQSGKAGSFLEIAGTTPLSSGSDVQRVDELRRRLTKVWGR